MMHATGEMPRGAHGVLHERDFQEALEYAWPELTARTETQAALLAILDDGSLSELARLGDTMVERASADIWSDSAWIELIDGVRSHDPQPHVDPWGRTLVPITRGPILYGALEVRSPSIESMDEETMARVNDSLSPVLIDFLAP